MPISDRDGPGETVREFDLVDLLFDRRPQLDPVDVAKDEHRLGDLAEGFARVMALSLVTLNIHCIGPLLRW